MSSIRLIKGSVDGSSGLKEIAATSSSLGPGGQEYGIHETFKYGNRQALKELLPTHPLEDVITDFEGKRIQMMDSAKLLAFGLHMPLAASMDRNAIEDIARHGSPLAKNTIAYDILTRRDISLDFDDFLGNTHKKYDFDPHQMLEFRYDIRGFLHIEMEDDIDSFYAELGSLLSTGEVRELKGHRQKVLTVGWSCDGTKLASGSVDQITRVYTNVKNGNGGDAIELKGHTGDVDQLCWNPVHPQRLATASVDCSVILWDLRVVDKSKNSHMERKISTPGENINICWSPDGGCVAVGNKEDVVCFIDPRGGTDAEGARTYIWNMIKSDTEVNEISWNGAGDLFFLTTGQGSIQILQFSSFKKVCDLVAHTANCYCIEFDATGRYFATGGADAIVGLWDARDIVCVRTLCHLEWPVRTLSFSFDGALIASGSEDRYIDISAVETGEVVHTLPCSAAMNSAAWSPTEYLLAYAGDDIRDRDPEGNLRVFGISTNTSIFS